MSQTTEQEQLARQADPYLSAFEAWGKEQGEEPGWVYPIRKGGISHFAEKGFPTVKDEDWRFTNIKPITELPFKPVVAPSWDEVTEEMLANTPFAQVEGHRLVFVDGRYAPDLSTVHPLPEGVTVGGLAEQLAADAPVLKEHLAGQINGQENAFTALNTAFFQDGAFIWVPAGKQVEQPVHLLFISTAKEQGATTHPRNFIVAERGSRLKIIETYIGVGDAPYLTNAVTESIIGHEAEVEHCKVQDESLDAFHMGTLYCLQGSSSRYSYHAIALGSRISRNMMRPTLDGEGLECLLNGLYITRGNQVADNYMIVDHAKPHGESHEYFNGIMDDRSKGVFHGRILVRPHSQKTDAKQTNRNVLLSDGAVAHAKPQLEIYADDVKCTHGATCGQLDPNAIFYLRARGISEANARRILVHAFAGEILERIANEPVREELSRMVWDRLERLPRIAEGG